MRVSRLIPLGQTIVSVPMGTVASDALATMVARDLSQLPVTLDGVVIGLFSFRSFAEHTLLPRPKSMHVEELPVEECLEGSIVYRSAADSYDSVIDQLHREGVILLGSETELIGIVTPDDAVRFFDNVAHALLMIRETELTVRRLIRAVFSNDDAELTAYAKMVLAKTQQYPDAKVKSDLADMTIADYRKLIEFTDTPYSDKFIRVFGRRDVSQEKLKTLNDLRNKTFHFHAEPDPKQSAQLKACRSWATYRYTYVTRHLGGN